VVLLGLCGSTAVLADLNIGDSAPPVIISGDNGGRVDGTPFDSSIIQGRVFTVFYVDPDEKDINEAMEAALGKEDFPPEKYQSVGIINMDATWLPNTFIESALSSKQEKFPQVIYVKDKKKVLVNKWGIKDDAYVVLVFDKLGKVIFKEVGTLNTARINEMIATIKSHLDK